MSGTFNPFPQFFFVLGANASKISGLNPGMLVAIETPAKLEDEAFFLVCLDGKMLCRCCAGVSSRASTRARLRALSRRTATAGPPNGNRSRVTPRARRPRPSIRTRGLAGSTSLSAGFHRRHAIRHRMARDAPACPRFQLRKRADDSADRALFLPERVLIDLPRSAPSALPPTPCCRSPFPARARTRQRVSPRSAHRTAPSRTRASSDSINTTIGSSPRWKRPGPYITVETDGRTARTGGTQCSTRTSTTFGAT